MKAIKKNFKVHFIGIGGVSMSSLAKYLLRAGFKVSGSDSVSSEYTDDLIKLGAKVFIGHDGKNLGEADIVVYNSAIGEQNAELSLARSSGLFVISRAELLSMIAENFAQTVGVSGCHGKTTVTCMLAHIYKCAGERFTAHIGGKDRSLGNFYYTGNNTLISEVCEFKKNIDLFTPTYGICLNTDLDHLDSYEGEEDLKNSYFSFLKRAKRAVIFQGDKNLKTYDGQNAVTFGWDENADYYPVSVEEEGGKYAFTLMKRGEKCFTVKLGVYGRHNVINAVAAAACAFEGGVSSEAIKKGLAKFTGTERRFEKIGKIDGATVVADYAHHPEEIAAAINTAKSLTKGRTVVVFQPHTYSRTLFLKDKFIEVLSGVEDLILYKTYPAREEYIYGGSAYDLYVSLSKRGFYAADPDALMGIIRARVRKNDLVLVLGAGDIYETVKRRL